MVDSAQEARGTRPRESELGTGRPPAQRQELIQLGVLREHPGPERRCDPPHPSSSLERVGVGWPGGRRIEGVLCLVAQLYPTLCDPMDCSLPGSSVHGDSPGKKIGVGCHSLLQGIFPTQGLNLGLLSCRWILYHLSHQGSPFRGKGHHSPTGPRTFLRTREGKHL